MKRSIPAWTIAALAAAGIWSAPVAAQDVAAAEALMKKSGCNKCHSLSAEKEGPPFKKTAAKYKGKADAEAKLVAALDSGQGHPKSKGSPADNKALVKWVLGM